MYTERDLRFLRLRRLVETVLVGVDLQAAVGPLKVIYTGLIANFSEKIEAIKCEAEDVFGILP